MVKWQKRARFLRQIGDRRCGTGLEHGLLLALLRTVRLTYKAQLLL
ncbi:hypothetical protein CCACVL1_02800 [Corchorus capsularis]|uniref:Uncharacterized protein n=1 Tax=Corchorus capsularis TaxID=210143 RepID=A0A1R3K5S2_COCAP|nr:hypothetical protein CCACVL1_03029 [Corchorus capsularis]OMP02445.1 hypothetical protein CCACVL1_02800 [Corchorus capsularis]